MKVLLADDSELILETLQEMLGAFKKSINQACGITFNIHLTLLNCKTVEETYCAPDNDNPTPKKYSP